MMEFSWLIARRSHRHCIWFICVRGKRGNISTAFISFAIDNAMQTSRKRCEAHDQKEVHGMKGTIVCGECAFSRFVYRLEEIFTSLELEGSTIAYVDFLFTSCHARPRWYNCRRLITFGMKCCLTMNARMRAIQSAQKSVLVTCAPNDCDPKILGQI